MPISVNLPTKIRIHQRALMEHPDWIDEALDAALGRAMANSRKIVLEARGAYVDVVCERPSFSWRGLRVEPELKSRIESRIAAVYDGLVRKHRIGTVRGDVPEVIPPDPSEVFDRSRGHLIGGIYVVDSYDSSQDTVAIAGDGDDGMVAIVAVATDVFDEDIVEQLLELAAKASPQHPLGVIFRLSMNGRTGWQVIITDGLKGKDANVAGAFTFDDFVGREFLGANASPPWRQVAIVPPPMPAFAEAFDVSGGLDGVRALAKRLIEPGHKTWLRRHWVKPPSMTTNKYEEAIDDKTARAIDTISEKAAEKNPTKAVQVRMGGTELVLWITEDREPWRIWKGIAALVPIEAYVKKPPDHKKSGKGAAGGDADATGSTGAPGGAGKCPHDDRPDDHPPDDVEESYEELPFLGEPSLDEIGDAGEVLGKKIDALARKLAIPSIKYAGQFCYHAASAIKFAAIDAQSMPETAVGDNKAAGSAKGNMGVIQFTPDESSIISIIRDLAGAVADIADLMRTVEAFYCSHYYRCSIHGIWRGKGDTWSRFFREAVAPVVKEGVGAMFIAACRSMLIQLLATSRMEIDKRLHAIDRYAPLFERWIVPLIAEEADLETMRRKLRDHRYEATALAVGIGVVGPSPVRSHEWMAANRKLLLVLKGGIVRQQGEKWEIVQDGGKDEIRDAKGVLWSAEELEQALALHGQVAEGADPLVKQFVDTPEAVQKLKTSDSIRATLEDLLKEMVQNNREMADKADSDCTFAFKATGMSENIPHATISGGKYVLQGIHKTAHEQIGDAFHGSGFYPEGVDDLFDSELGKEALKGAAIMVGMVALSVFVPGGAFLAFAAGGVLAAHDLTGAYEKKRLYRSLINPDQVLSYAEVELAIFLGWFSAVMAAIPEVGNAAKGLIAGGKAVIKGEVRAAGKAAAKAIAVHVAESLAEFAVKDLLAAFVKEMVVAQVLDVVIQRLMAPLIAEVEHEASIGHGEAPRAVDEEELAFIAFVNALEELD